MDSNCRTRRGREIAPETSIINRVADPRPGFIRRCGSCASSALIP